MNFLNTLFISSVSSETMNFLECLMWCNCSLPYQTKHRNVHLEMVLRPVHLPASARQRGEANTHFCCSMTAAELPLPRAFVPAVTSHCSLWHLFHAGAQSDQGLWFFPLLGPPHNPSKGQVLKETVSPRMMSPDSLRWSYRLAIWNKIRTRRKTSQWQMF